jgi:tetratricopeptide (TPR) repeat protein
MKSSDHLQEARQLLAAGQLPEAIRSLQEWIATQPADAEAHALLGVALGMQGDTAAAARSLETAIQFDPQQPTFHFNLGQVREKQGDPSGAVTAYQAALQLNPTYERAAAAYQRLTAVPPGFVPPETGGGVPATAPPAATAPWLAGTAAAASDPSGTWRAAEPAGAPAAAPRRLADAPQIVRSIRSLYWLGIFLWSLGLIGLLAARGEPDQSPGETLVGLILATAILGVTIWLLWAVPRGHPAAFSVQLVVSALGLLGFPLGTILHGYILYCWLKPETRAWFDVS